MDNMIQLTRSRALSCSAAHVASSSATRSIEQRCLRIQPHCRAPLLAAAARSRVAPTTARRSRCGRHCRRRPAQPTSCTRDEHTCAPTCKPIERAQCRGCRCACGGGGDTQAAVRAAAKRARGCSSAKRTHLRAAMAASRTAAAYCARSARSAPSEARAASASRSSTPDGFLFCGPQESKRDKHESAAKARGGEAEADAQERAVRKPYQSCRTGCERAHWSMYIMLQRRLFSPPLSASTEPMATLRRGATCGADVAAACGNALTSWRDFVRQSVTPSSPSSGYRGRKKSVTHW